MPKTDSFLARVVRKAKSNLEAKLDFGENIIAERKEGLTPFTGQLLRVHEAVENGTKRIAFADATGFGKTYVGTMILGMLNKNKNKRHKVLLIAPQQSIETAWSESEMNGYLSGLGISNGKPLRISYLNNGNLDINLREADIVALNYHKFNCETSEKYIKSVLDASNKFDMVFFDESQNNRNFLKRGQNIERLIQETKRKRALIFSATPGYNGTEDLGMPLHILDPDYFPFAKYDYNSNPSAIKQLILNGQWFSSDRKLVQKLFNLPDLTERVLKIDLGRHYSAKYLDVWQNGELDIITKIHQLRKLSILGKLKSEEGKKQLEELLESFPEEQQVLTFTHLKTGVTPHLIPFLERFYGKGKVGLINGDVHSVKKRVEISQRFTNGEYRALANSLLTMSEGIPCITNERPVSMLFLEMPYNHGQLHQSIGRAYRPGQKGDVSLFYFIAENEWLSSQMEKLVRSGELEERYGVEFPSGWRPSTIDLDIYDLFTQKDILDEERVKKGIRLDEAQEAIMSFNESSISSVRNAENKGILFSLPKKIKKKRNGKYEEESSWSIFSRGAHFLYGQGEEALLLACKGKGDFVKCVNEMRRAYRDKKVLYSSSGDTARLIKHVISGLEEERGKPFRDILDLGCGTGIVSRILERDITNLDLDAEMLEECRRLGHGKCVRGRITNLPFESRSFDLLTASYSFFYLKQREEERELERALLESNRVLRNNGYLISTLVRTTTDRDLDLVGNSLEDYGFNLLIKDYFRGLKENGTKSKFKGVYLLVGRKENNTKSLAENSFEVFKPRTHCVSRAHSRVTSRDGNAGRKKKFDWNYSYDFQNSEGTTIGEILEGLKI